MKLLKIKTGGDEPLNVRQIEDQANEEYNNTINLKIDNHPLNPINLEEYNKNEKDYVD